MPRQGHGQTDANCAASGPSPPKKLWQVAELETAVELQNMEIKALTKLLEEKSQQMAGLLAAVPRLAGAL